MFRLTVTLVLVLGASCGNSQVFRRRYDDDSTQTDFSHLCGPNSHWTTCATKCPPTCRDYSPKTCRMMCAPACQCDLLHVKNDEGDCVFWRDCEAQRPESPPPESSRSWLPNWMFRGSSEGANENQ